MPQLLAFLTGSFLTSASFGLAVLLFLHHGIPAENRFNGARVQIILGVAALIAAVILARTGGPTNGEATPSKLVGWISARAGRVVSGSSPWFAAALGVGLAIPSVDYLALLLLISTSGGAPGVQISALLTFLTVANAVLLVPLTSYLLTPQRTRAALERLRTWVLARRRRDYAILLAIAGVLMIGVGISGM
jgi:hypothetical protein